MLEMFGNFSWNFPWNWNWKLGFGNDWKFFLELSMELEQDHGNAWKIFPVDFRTLQCETQDL